jgi:methylated-DNA-protein-cysteine methyltransferase related protein
MTKGTAVERGVPARLRERIFAAVRAVPRGGVVSYGDVARACGTIPIVVGKALAHSIDGVPWQRVVGQDGTLRTARRGAEFAARQRALLEAEGVAFAGDGRVDGTDPGWERGLAALGVAKVMPARKRAGRP